jgi:hypothetical protein
MAVRIRVYSCQKRPNRLRARARRPGGGGVAGRLARVDGAVAVAVAMTGVSRP